MKKLSLKMKLTLLYTILMTALVAAFCPAFFIGQPSDSVFGAEQSSAPGVCGRV